MKRCCIRVAAMILALAIAAGPGLTMAPSTAKAAKGTAQPDNSKQTLQDRQQMFEQIGTVTGIPWYNLAAIDQYDRTISVARKRPASQGLIAVYYSEADWAGMLNPDKEDRNSTSIAFFGGMGQDGTGDGLADRNNDYDVLATLIMHLKKFDGQKHGFSNALWEHYHNPRSVERILQFAKMYQNAGTLDLFQHAFPLPLNSNYTYRSTWGASRGWGGFRIHEGTDLFANYGVPVRSACYGIVEVRGWNPYGGWRTGIRDLNNVYHYYAHLSGFNKKLRKGDIVNPGDVIGWVGSSGYGKPGTQGKFPPHLHYGLYRDNGLSEWSFDPYPYLRRWEQEERKRRAR